MAGTQVQHTTMRLRTLPRRNFQGLGGGSPPGDPLLHAEEVAIVGRPHPFCFRRGGEKESFAFPEI